jgi:hypothetical protein
MLGLLRFMSGRRLLIAAVLVVLLLSGSTALRAGAARLLACGVSLQMGDPTGATGSRVAAGISGGQVPRLPPSQCLHEVTRGVTAATAWLRSHRDAGQVRPGGAPPTHEP